MHTITILVSFCSLTSAALTRVSRLRSGFAGFREKMASLEPFVAPLSPSVDFSEHCHKLIDYSHHHEHWMCLKKDIIATASSPRNITQLTKVASLRAKALPFSEQQVTETIMPFIEELEKEIKASEDIEKVTETIAAEQVRLELLMQARTFDFVAQTLDNVDDECRDMFLDHLSPAFRLSLFKEMNPTATYLRIRQEVPLIQEDKWINHFLESYLKMSEELTQTGRTKFSIEEFSQVMRKHLLHGIEDEHTRQQLEMAMNIFMDYKAAAYEIVGSLANE